MLAFFTFVFVQQYFVHWETGKFNKSRSREMMCWFGRRSFLVVERETTESQVGSTYQMEEVSGIPPNYGVAFEVYYR
jgi:hypothetical protein